MMTDENMAEIARYERLTFIVTALIETRVTASTAIVSGTSKGSAAQIAADAKAIMAALDKA